MFQTNKSIRRNQSFRDTAYYYSGNPSNQDNPQPLLLHPDVTTRFASDKPFSVCAWISFTDTYTSHALFAITDEWAMGVNSGAITFIIRDASATAYIGRKTVDLSAEIKNRWRHYCFTWDGSTSSSGIKIYLDGIQVDSANEESGTFLGLEESENGLYIATATGGDGTVIGHPKGHFNFTDFAVYGKALERSDILTIMNGRQGFDHRTWNKRALGGGSNDLKHWLPIGESRDSFKVMIGGFFGTKFKDMVHGEEYVDTTSTGYTRGSVLTVEWWMKGPFNRF